jgi:hypothetical protein
MDSGLGAERNELVNSRLGPLPGPASPDEPQPSADDAATIEASWSDPERFAALFDRHAALVHRYIARRVGPVIADDLVAETFLAAFRRRKRYDRSCRDAPFLAVDRADPAGQAVGGEDTPARDPDPGRDRLPPRGLAPFAAKVHSMLIKLGIGRPASTALHA